MSVRLRRSVGALALAVSAAASPAQPPAAPKADALTVAAAAAQAKLRQSFTNLQFDHFAQSPIRGPIYQASAGGRILYYAPESEHLLFAAVYDRNGVNLTALAQDEETRTALAAIDPTKALAIGPSGAPTVIEFTDPDCPYCHALDRYWAVKATEGKPVRRLIYFVSAIHPGAAGKAEHILCSPDPAAAFKAVYAGAVPPVLRTCAAGHAKVEADAKLVRDVGVSGTPTLIVDGRRIAGFQQAELDALLAAPAAAHQAAR